MTLDLVYFDDATSSPHASNARIVQVPFELQFAKGNNNTSIYFSSVVGIDSNLLRGFSHKHEALSVRYNLRRIKCLLEIIDELLLVTTEGLFLWASDDFACARTLGFDSG